MVCLSEQEDDDEEEMGGVGEAKLIEDESMAGFEIRVEFRLDEAELSDERSVMAVCLLFWTVSLLSFATRTLENREINLV